MKSSDAFQTALRDGDLAGVRARPKADLHVHGIGGGSRAYLRERWGRDVAPVDRLLGSMAIGLPIDPSPSRGSHAGGSAPSAAASRGPPFPTKGKEAGGTTRRRRAQAGALGVSVSLPHLCDSIFYVPVRVSKRVLRGFRLHNP